MKLNQFVLLAIAPIMIVSTSLVSSAAPVPAPFGTELFKVVESMGGSGKFVKAEKETTGMARVITENGHRYIELDSAFSTSNQGPDLHVLLDPAAMPSANYANQGNVINLGRLRSYQGTQRYAIPDVIKLDDYKSVVIWCRMANATFGYAPIGTP